jgi:two-component system, LytTR family, sensor kinase
MKKSTETVINIIFWVVTGVAITHSFSVQEYMVTTLDNGQETIKYIRDEDIFIKLILAVLLSVIMFYANLNYVLKFKRNDNRLKFAIRSVLFLLLAIALYYLLEVHLKLFPSQFSLAPSIIISVFAFYFTASIAYGLIIILWDTEKQKQQFKLEKTNAQLSLLRSQLHPHFLFNVLNNLLAMVDQESSPAFAQSMEKLSQLLRYVVYETQGEQVSVKKEIYFIRNYAELQALRFEKNELQFKLEIKGEFENQKIEPGIFIPFIENAFKHGVRPEVHSEISVNFDLTQKYLVKFSVTNLIQKNAWEAENKGTSISATKERLELVYPGRHKLEIIEKEYFEVNLEINSAEIREL